MKNRKKRGRAGTAREKKDLEPKRRVLRLHLDEEVFSLLEESCRASWRNRTWHAEFLLENAIRASWAYLAARDSEVTRQSDIPAVKSARDFFSELYRLQRAALEEVERAGDAAKNAASAAAQRCQQWLDAEKVRRSGGAAGPRVLAGKFGPAPNGSTL